MYREGEGLDTEYELGVVSDEPIAEEIWDEEGIADLPTIEEIFRDKLSMGNSAAGGGGGEGVLGSDAVDTGSAAEELPSVDDASPAPEETPAAEGPEELGDASSSSPEADTDGLI